jgi:hypothetical protein
MAIDQNGFGRTTHVRPITLLAGYGKRQMYQDARTSAPSLTSCGLRHKELLEAAFAWANIELPASETYITARQSPRLTKTRATMSQGNRPVNNFRSPFSPQKLTLFARFTGPEPAPHSGKENQTSDKTLNHREHAPPNKIAFAFLKLGIEYAAVTNQNSRGRKADG